MVAIRVNYGGDVEEVEGVPLAPDVNEYYDEESGECNITFAKCDCQKNLVRFGCTKCERSVDKYIQQMIKSNTIKPFEKVAVKRPGQAKEYEFYRNKINSVFLHTDEELEAVRDNWWFRFLKETPASLWNVTVEKYEYPCAFALFEAIGRKKPERVLYGYELPMVWIFPNMYYVIAPALWRDPEVIKADYLDGEIKEREAREIEEETKRKQEQAYKERQEGNKKTSVPDNHKRPVIPTRTKRTQYRKNPERKVYTEPPGIRTTFATVRDGQTKEYHTTRGVKVRKS